MMCSYYDAIKTAVQVAAYTFVQVQERKTQKKIETYENQRIIEAAKLEEEKAGEERQNALEETRAKKLQTILNLGKEKSAFASGNLSLSSLTLSDIEDDEKQAGELDALKTVNMAERRAKNNLIQADRYYANAALNSFKSQQKYKKGLMTIAGNAANTVATSLFNQ